MAMTGFLDVVAVGATVGLVAVAEIPWLSDAGKVSQLGVSGLLALVAIAAVVGLVVVSRQKDALNTELKRIIEKCTAALTEVRDELRRCHDKTVGRQP